MGKPLEEQHNPDKEAPEIMALRSDKVGASVLLKIHQPLLSFMRIFPATKVGQPTKDSRLSINREVVSASLENYLDRCNGHAELTEEDQQWLNSGAVGKELL